MTIQSQINFINEQLNKSNMELVFDINTKSLYILNNNIDTDDKFYKLIWSEEYIDNNRVSKLLNTINNQIDFIINVNSFYRDFVNNNTSYVLKSMTLNSTWSTIHMRLHRSFDNYHINISPTITYKDNDKLDVALDITYNLEDELFKRSKIVHDNTEYTITKRALPNFSSVVNLTFTSLLRDTNFNDIHELINKTLDFSKKDNYIINIANNF